MLDTGIPAIILHITPGNNHPTHNVPHSSGGKNPTIGEIITEDLIGHDLIMHQEMQEALLMSHIGKRGTQRTPRITMRRETTNMGNMIIIDHVIEALAPTITMHPEKEEVHLMYHTDLENVVPSIRKTIMPP